jgi:hypothetical protein
MGLASSLSIVKSVGIVLASTQLVLGGRASRRRRRRLERRRVNNIKLLVCMYTHRLFGDTCPVPSYKPQEYQEKLWKFHQENCMPKEKRHSFGDIFIILFAIILSIFICFIAH